MKRAFGVLELLIVIIILLVVYFTCFSPKYGRKNPFDDNSKINSQQEMINDKINEIEDIKQQRQIIENNLKKGY